MVYDLDMLIDEVSKQLESYSQFLNFLEKYGKMPRDIREKMHDGCNSVNNLNQIQNCKFQKLLISQIYVLSERIFTLRVDIS